MRELNLLQKYLESKRHNKALRLTKIPLRHCRQSIKIAQQLRIVVISHPRFIQKTPARVRAYCNNETIKYASYCSYYYETVNNYQHPIDMLRSKLEEINT